MAEAIHNLGLKFQRIAEEHPAAPALLVEGQTYSFETLNRLANRAARWFLGRGIRRDQVICLELPKIVEAYSAALGCIKAGIPYAFLDPTAPPERARLALDRCRPALIVSVHDGAGERLVLGDSQQREAYSRLLADCGDANLAETAKITGADPAYVMFTSGSTGEPKGAVIPHQGVLNLAEWANSSLGIGPADRLTNVNPLHFDNSVFDMYAGLLNGASIVALEALKGRPPSDVVDEIAARECTFFFAVPTLFMFLDSMQLLTPERLPHVTRFMFGGEGFPLPQLRRFHEAFAGKAELINCYGPTETSCICSSFPITGAVLTESEGFAPLGRLNPNFSYRVLDGDLTPVTPGEIGELWLGGPCVGLGYINNPEETAKRFRQDPSASGYRSMMYRTGDLVQEDLRTGVFSFRGRADNQIKLNGHRIELEEIDHALQSIPGIDRALAIAVQGGSGAVRLMAAYSGRRLDTSELLAHCRDRLPPYMTPGKFAWLETIPTNANGKADRRAVAAMVAG